MTSKEAFTSTVTTKTHSVAITHNHSGTLVIGKNRFPTMAPQTAAILRADDIIIDRVANTDAPLAATKQHPGNIKFQELLRYYRSLIDTYNPKDPSILVDMLYFDMNDLGRRFLLLGPSQEFDTTQAASYKNRVYPVLSKDEIYAFLQKELHLEGAPIVSAPISSWGEASATIVTPFSSPEHIKRVRVHDEDIQAKIQASTPYTKISALFVSSKDADVHKLYEAPKHSSKQENQASAGVHKIPVEVEITTDSCAGTITPLSIDAEYIRSKLDEIMVELTGEKNNGKASDAASTSKSEETELRSDGQASPPTPAAIDRVITPRTNGKIKTTSVSFDTEDFDSKVELDATDVIVGRTCNTALHFCTNRHAGNLTYRRFLEHSSFLLKNSSPEDHSYLIRALFTDVDTACGRFVRLIKENRAAERRTTRPVGSIVSDEDMRMVIQMDLSLLADMPILYLDVGPKGPAMPSVPTWMSGIQIQYLVKKELKLPMQNRRRDRTLKKKRKVMTRDSASKGEQGAAITLKASHTEPASRKHKSNEAESPRASQLEEI